MHLLHELNPYQFLGVSKTAGDQEIRAAYLAMLRNHPPDRDQQQFQKIQRAYECVKDSESRMHHRLFHVVTVTPELINQSIQHSQQAKKRVDLSTFQAVLKTEISKIKPPSVE